MKNKQNLKYFLTILVSLILISCSSEKEVLLEDLYEGDDYLFYKKKSDIPYTGIAVSYHKKEQIFSKKQLSSFTNILSGKIEGVVEYYHSNGALESKWPYVDNKVEGVVEYYDSNGALRSIWPYIDNKVEGVVEIYNQYGVLRQKKFIINGMQESAEFYDEYETLSRIEKYTNEKNIYSETYSQRGDLLSIKNFNEDGKYDGLVTKYERVYCDSNSGFLCSDRLNKKFVTTYKNGIAHGDAKVMRGFYNEFKNRTQDDSNPWYTKSANFVNGIIDGQVTTIQRSMNTDWSKSLVTCKNGKANGPSKSYFSDGRLNRVSEWKDNKRHGVFIDYSWAHDHHINYSETWIDGAFRSCDHRAPFSRCDGSKSGFEEFKTCAASSAEDL